MVALTSALISKKFWAGKLNICVCPLMARGFKLLTMVSDSISSGKVCRVSLNPKSEGLRIEILHVLSHCQNDFSAWGFKYHSSPDRCNPLDLIVLLLFLKNRVSISV